MRATRLLSLAGLLAASWIVAPHPAAGAPGGRATAAQQAGRDTAAVVGDTTTRDTASVASDTAPTLRSMPDPPDPPPAFASRRFTCARRCLLDHNAVVLMDLLEREMPGITMLRGSYFGGPHQIRSGALGAGFTRVRLDGRPVPALAGGQVDLARIPVERLDRITVTETPAGVTLEATPVRREEPRAYSRISAGTGEPDVESIRALFTNGVGQQFEVSTGLDLLNAGGEGTGGDRFDFWGNVAWLPEEDGAGVELQWRNQTLDRRGLDTASVNRREIHLVGRGRPAEDVWITVSAGRSVREISGTGETAQPADSGRIEVDAASAELRLGTGPDFLEARIEARDGPGHPSSRASLGGGVEAIGGLALSGRLSGSRWDRFDGWTVEAGATYRADLGVDLELGVGGAAGVRGAARPLEARSDSVTFRQGQARASARWGPASATVRGMVQEVSRTLPFGGTFDPGLEAGPGVELGAVEGTLGIPILPLDWFLGPGVEPVRLSATWRHQEVLDGASEGGEGEGNPAPAALYLPADQARLATYFHDSFFQGDLRVRAELAVRHRSSMRTVDPAGGTGRVQGWTTLDWNLLLNIKDVRIWWRVDNTRGAPWEDAVGIRRPARRNVFGVEWEFFN